MSHENIETNTPLAATPQLPTCELPSLDRIQIQAIMAAILYAFRRPSYDRETEVKAAVRIAADLLERIEQEERGYIAQCSEDERYLRASEQSQD
jgi:hypothetical protein